MTRRSIQLGDREIAYTVARSRRRRTIGLKIGEQGLVITLPSSLGLHHAERAAREKQGWILDRLERAAARARPKLRGLDGETIGWLGGELKLAVTAHQKARTVVERGAGRLEVRIDARLEPEMADATVRRALHRWRKEEALALMTPKLEHYADRLGAKRPRVFVREQAARWGSCSADGSIRMNARLIHFDEALIDYVCAHEACHLLVMDHSPRFHALMDTLMPDHKHLRRRMREETPPGVEF
ncbi:MAG: SprT family zinc-dependent metalloprotease [Oceanicaulis sp.]